MTISDAEFAPSDYAAEAAPDRLDAGANAYTDITGIYLNQIGKVALLTAEEEVSLAKRIEAGLYAGHKLARAAEEGERPNRQLQRDLWQIKREGERAKEHLLAANTRLVVNLAKRANNQGLGLMDRIQEGNLGLIRAVEKFDYKQGFKFSTYATWWIRQAITRGQADTGRTVRLPVHMVEQISKISRVRKELCMSLGRDPTDEELAAETNLGVGMLRYMLKSDHNTVPVSLDKTVGEKESETLGGFMIDAEGADPVFASVANTDQNDRIRVALATLSERDRDVVCRRYGLYDGRVQTLGEISKAYGMSRERVRQIERSALTKLRGSDQSDALKDFY